jgi:hypothetical protein
LEQPVNERADERAQTLPKRLLMLRISMKGVSPFRVGNLSPPIIEAFQRAAQDSASGPSDSSADK